MSDSRVKIVNNEPVKSVQLIGVRLMDDRPISEALVAMGVDDSELEDWTVVNTHSEENHTDGVEKNDGNTVVLSNWWLMNKMTNARLSCRDETLRDAVYDDAFRENVGISILNQLAVAVTKNKNPNLKRNSDRAALAGKLVGYLGGAFGAKYGLEIDNFFSQAVIGYAGAITLNGICRSIFSAKRHGKRMVKEAAKSNPQLEERIARSTLPIYSK